MGLGAEIVSSVLLFGLVFGMSATVELKQLRKQLRNRSALLIGLFLQFIILPFCGFVVVKILQPPAVMGITLLVVTSSPGGSYSNWWCSLFNAELSLSITMTAISTLLSTVMLPANLALYTTLTYSSDVVKSLDWYALFVSLVVVIGGIACGLISSKWTKMNENISTALFHRRANLMGNIAGIALITLSITVSSTGTKAALWDQSAAFYIGVAMPFFLGLTAAVFLTSKLELEKPERVAVAVESSFQNTGIATSVAITMFGANEQELAQAIGVPLYYGLVEAVGLAIFCLICWKMGWTKAPANENLCVVIYNSYEVEEQEIGEQEIAIEIVLGGGDDKTFPNDLVFEQTDDGAYIVDDESLHKVRNAKKNQSLPDSPVTSDESGGDSPTLSSSTLSEDMDEGGHGHSSPPQNQQPQGITRTIATIRARATGYRQPPQPERQYQQDPRILSALDESEEFAPPPQVADSRPSNYAPIGLASPEPRKKTPSSLPAEGGQID